ncbi:hypothetical protein [Corynebacterium glutamicum]|uniref:hypothetical protein n=1 Tax=Corynebacterium glutamicum TaxID=1718 RepID=UPI001C0D65B1|nr:hypothetical protein [Corynebacterium glutamicum]
MKRITTLITVTLAMITTLVACGNPSDQSTATNNTTTETTSESNTVTGEIGFVHGIDCQSAGDCSLTFTINELSKVSECTDGFGPILQGDLIFISGTISSLPQSYDSSFDTSWWPVSVNWSTTSDDGIDRPIEIESNCLPDDGWRGTWDQDLRQGDTREFSQYMSIPTDAKTLRITDSIHGGGRWEFSIPNEEKVTPPEPTTPTVTEDYTPIVTSPAVEPITEPVIGFTEAPGVAEPTVMNKIISSCATDPTIYQRGTTWFTDGTSGWTHICAEAMDPAIAALTGE